MREKYTRTFRVDFGGWMKYLNKAAEQLWEIKGECMRLYIYYSMIFVFV